MRSKQVQDDFKEWLATKRAKEEVMLAEEFEDDEDDVPAVLTDEDEDEEAESSLRVGTSSSWTIFNLTELLDDILPQPEKPNVFIGRKLPLRETIIDPAFLICDDTWVVLAFLKSPYRTYSGKVDLDSLFSDASGDWRWHHQSSHTTLQAR